MGLQYHIRQQHGLGGLGSELLELSATSLPEQADFRGAPPRTLRTTPSELCRISPAAACQCAQPESPDGKQKLRSHPSESPDGQQETGILYHYITIIVFRIIITLQRCNVERRPCIVHHATLQRGKKNWHLTSWSKTSRADRFSSCPCPCPSSSPSLPAASQVRRATR